MYRFFESYIDDLKKSIDSLDQDILFKIIQKIMDTKRKNGFIYLMGNGGSAATPSHSAGDWTKELGIKTISLTDNVAAVTAFGNDTSFDNIFKGQLEVFCGDNDLVIGYSGSGNSANVINGILFAKEKGLTTIGITGNYKNGHGGILSKISDIVLIVNSNSMERIEDMHLIINHIIKEYLKNHF